MWIFFTDPVPAVTARQLGTALVREAIAIRGRMGPTTGSEVLSKLVTVLTPLEPAVVCGDMQLAVATVTSDDQRIECRA